MKRTLLISLLFCGCIAPSQKYITVSASYDIVTKNSGIYPQVVSSPSIADKFKKYKGVMICLPDHSESSRSQSRLVDSDKLVYAPEKVLTSEIEKQFMKNGFSVYSAQKYYDSIRSGLISRNQAASEMGVDFLININSLEFSDSDRLRQTANIRLTCRTSQGKDEKGKPSSLDTYFTDHRIESIKEAFATGITSDMFSVYLDVSVINVRTGEVIFIYKNRLYSFDPSDSLNRELKFKYKSDPINGRRINIVKDDTPQSEAFSGTYSVESQNQAIRSDIVEIMVERICTDFIDHLIKQ